LNQWVKQETRFIDMADWDGCSAVIDLAAAKELTWYAGLDLSTKLDLTALVLVAKDAAGAFNLLPFFWLPKDNLQDRPNQESAKYRIWSEKGYITLTEGTAVDFAAVRKRLNELRDQAGLKIKQVAFDPWAATQLAQQLTEDSFLMVEVSQTFRHLSEPTKELQSSVVQRNVRHGGHPVLRWMADCMTVKSDINGNVRPVKPDRLKSSKRVDGIVAAIMGLGRAIVDDSKPSVYEDAGIRWLG
jgi:phage terminase large subunit-like protein